MLTGQTLPAFDRGDDFGYGPITLTIPTGRTDPATWTNVRLGIVDGAGNEVVTDLSGQTTVAADGTVTTAGSGVIVKASTGSGPWTLTLDPIPLSQVQTLFLGAWQCAFQIDFTSASGKPDTLVRGSVSVEEPDVGLPAE